jgi:hypothetical protein
VIRRALRVAFLACLLVIGAAGLSSLEDDDFCGEHGPAVEGSSWSSRVAVWPPGEQCVYSLPGGGEATVDAGSVESFLVVLATELLIAGWLVRQWPLISRQARAAAVTMLTFSVAGAGALAGGFLLAMLLGWILGVPLAAGADRALQRAAGERPRWHAGLLAALVAAVALMIAGFLWLVGLGVWAFVLALAGTALTGARAKPRPIQAARG